MNKGKTFDITGAIDSYGCQKSWVDYNLQKCKDEEVTIRINSPGGSVDQAMAIAQSIKDHGKVTVQLFGCCASAATWLGFAAKKVQISEDALWLCHQSSGLVAVWKSMKAKDIDSLIKQLESQKKSQEAIDANIAKMYCARTKKNEEDVISLMDEEKWINAKEVVDWGFADEIVEGAIPMTKNARNQMIQNCVALHLPEPNVPEVKDDEETFINKIVNGIKEIFSSNGTPANQMRYVQFEQNNNKNKNNMKKEFTTINALLKIEGIAENEGQFTLSNEQIQTLENALASAGKQKEELEEVTKALNEVSEDVKNIDGLKNKVGTIKAILNRMPMVAPASATIPAKSAEDKIDFTKDAVDPVNKYFEN